MPTDGQFWWKKIKLHRMIVLDIKRKDYFLKTAKKVESKSNQVIFKHTKNAVKDRFYKTWLVYGLKKQALMASVEES